MPRFFIDSSDLQNDGGQEIIRIAGDDAGHITRVLRMKPGERVTVCDEAGMEYDCVIADTGREVLLNVREKHPSHNEPPYRAVVYQALVKGDRFDTVLMKSTELGASVIVPVITARCTVRLEPGEYPKKRERWQRIAAEAAKQCGRAVIPTVTDPVKFSDALREAAEADLPLFCYEEEAGGANPLPAVLNERESIASASVVIGPEGGFEPWEAEEAVRAGMRSVGLGTRILRTETAAPFVLSCLSFRYELAQSADVRV